MKKNLAFLGILGILGLTLLLSCKAREVPPPSENKNEVPYSSPLPEAEAFPQTQPHIDLKKAIDTFTLPPYQVVVMSSKPEGQYIIVFIGLRLVGYSIIDTEWYTVGYYLETGSVVIWSDGPANPVAIGSDIAIATSQAAERFLAKQQTPYFEIPH